MNNNTSPSREVKLSTWTTTINSTIARMSMMLKMMLTTIQERKNQVSKNLLSHKLKKRLRAKNWKISHTIWQSMSMIVKKLKVRRRMMK